MKRFTLMIGSEQPEVMVAFYTKVFDRAADMGDSAWSGWQVGDSFFSVGGHSEVHGKAKEPARMLFNFETPTVKEDFERMKAIPGAVVVKEPYQMEKAWIATLADPDGNYFQLMTPWGEA